MSLNLDVIRDNLADASNWRRNQRGSLVREWSGQRLAVTWTRNGYRWLIETPGRPIEASTETFNTEGQALRSLADAALKHAPKLTEGMT